MQPGENEEVDAESQPDAYDEPTHNVEISVARGAFTNIPSSSSLSSTEYVAIMFVITTLGSEIWSFMSSIYAKVDCLTTKVNGLQTEIKQVKETMATKVNVDNLTTVQHTHQYKLNNKLNVGLKQHVDMQSSIISDLVSSNCLCFLCLYRLRGRKC